MRPLLRPGTHVLRRADGSLQLGLDPARAVVLDARPELRAGLLDGSADSEDGVVGLLDSAGLLVDERVLMPLIGLDPSTSRRGSAIPRTTGAALVREAGPDASGRATTRAGCRVAVVGFGHPDGADLVDRLGDLLSRAGLRRERPRTAASPATRRRHRTVGVLLGVGEPDRELADPWLRDQTPYVVVRLTEGRAVVGPFVVPGRTACLRCVDAHHTDADREWPLLVRQYAEASSRDRADGSPEPVDPALAALAVAWAARDLASYVDGGRPSSWSSTLVFAPDLTTLETRSWLRHPECGCGWA
jgi:bacteriocin biosynthesis cyclodehydratase domain-containing protein